MFQTFSIALCIYNVVTATLTIIIYFYKYIFNLLYIILEIRISVKW